MANTSPAIEDYLKTIHAHTEWQPEPITPSVLATRLAVAPSSVTEMVKKLAAQGLVTHQPYGAIRLTDAGLSRALGVVRRHRLVETWLVSDMGYGWDAVHDEAEVLEHAISDRLLEAIDTHLGRPVRDPHGDPIPQADGSIVSVPTVLLSEAPAGHAGTVVRISDRDPLLLRRLAAGGIRPGVLVTLSGDTLDGPDGTAVELDADGREAIWLTA
ncbi:metal-dependent transcriptional regulator [Leifsonia sp. YIM 134122]|uniref:Manganese transport regulator n=1 Tax=Leifsonia stereocauli TaxID=3134136 RepID=A0ABU9W3V2_9MICO